MKLKLFLMIVVVAMISFGCERQPRYKESFSLVEMKTMIALKEATVLNDSVIISRQFYPIVSIQKRGYYPSESINNGVRYYLLKK